MAILTERDKTGKGRLPNVGDLRGIRIPEIEEKSVKTAAFPLSVAAAVSRLLQSGRLNMWKRVCYNARGFQREWFTLIEQRHFFRNRSPKRKPRNELGTIPRLRFGLQQRSVSTKTGDVQLNKAV